jgi:hypothetical protein
MLANSGAIGRAVQVVGGTSRREAAAVSIGNIKFER